jgi:hypothetical protein
VERAGGVVFNGSVEVHAGDNPVRVHAPGRGP